jgi:hypothetical protein
VKEAVALAIVMAVSLGWAGDALGQAQAPRPTEQKTTDRPAETTKKRVTQNASGTVKTASAEAFVVSGKAKGGREAEWTFAVDAHTKIRRSGKDITAADLAVGEPVLVRYHELGGKNVADAVMVRTVRKPAEASKGPQTKDESRR